MLARVISKYGLAFHLALLAAMPIALAPFLKADELIVPVFWFLGVGYLWFFAEPSVRRGEFHADARRRVFFALVHDPVFYCLSVVLLVAVIRACNTGVSMVYDVESSLWRVSDPMLPSFPCSVAKSGMLPLAIMMIITLVVVAFRHALGLSARIAFALFVSLFTGLGALVAVCFVCAGNPELLARATTSYSAGPFYGTLCGAFATVGVYAGVAAEGRKWHWARLATIVCVGGNLVGTIVFAHVYVSALYVLLAFVMAVFAIVWISRGTSRGVAARSIFFLFVGFGLPVVVFAFAPPALKSAKFATLDPKVALPTSYYESRQALSRVAKAIWLESPWCGAGEGAFRLRAPFLVERQEWTLLPDKPKWALNGYWQMLAERGIIGSLSAMVILGCLLVWWGIRLVGAYSFLSKSNESDVFIFACQPIVWLSPFVCVLVLLQTALAPVFALPAAPLALAVPMALAAASFPKKKEESHRDG